MCVCANIEIVILILHMSKLGCRAFIVFVLEDWPQHPLFSIPPLWRLVSHRWQETKRILHPLPLISSAHSSSGVRGLLVIQSPLLLHWIGWIRFTCAFFLLHSAPPLTEKEVEVSDSRTLGNVVTLWRGLPKPPFLQGLTLTFLHKSENCGNSGYLFPAHCWVSCACLHSWRILTCLGGGEKVADASTFKDCRYTMMGGFLIQSQPGNCTRFIWIFKNVARYQTSDSGLEDKVACPWEFRQLEGQRSR